MLTGNLPLHLRRQEAEDGQKGRPFASLRVTKLIFFTTFEDDELYRMSHKVYSSKELKMKVKFILFSMLVLVLALGMVVATAVAQDPAGSEALPFKIFLPVVNRTNTQSPKDAADVPQITVDPAQSIPSSLVWLEGTGFLRR
jgi:hypothetical protein